MRVHCGILLFPPLFYQRETVILLLISQKNRLRRTQKGHFRLLPLWGRCCAACLPDVTAQHGLDAAAPFSRDATLRALTRLVTHERGVTS